MGGTEKGHRILSNWLEILNVTGCLSELKATISCLKMNRQEYATPPERIKEIQGWLGEYATMLKGGANQMETSSFKCLRGKLKLHISGLTGSVTEAQIEELQETVESMYSIPDNLKKTTSLLSKASFERSNIKPAAHIANDMPRQADIQPALSPLHIGRNKPKKADDTPPRSYWWTEY